MKNKKWYIITVIVAVLLAPFYPAFAHGTDKEGKDFWGNHESMMCKPDGLSDKDAKLVHEAMKAAFEKDKPLFKKMHALHERMHEALAAKNFDKKAFLSLANRMEQLHGQILRHHAEAFASIAGKLSPEEREELVREFHEPMAGGMIRHHGLWRSHGVQDHKNDYGSLNK